MFTQQFFTISCAAFQQQNQVVTATQDGKVQQQQQQQDCDFQLWYLQPNITHQDQQEQIAGYSIINKQTQQALKFNSQTGQVELGAIQQGNAEFIWQMQAASQQTWVIFAANTSSCLTIDQDQVTVETQDFQQLNAQQFIVSIAKTLDLQQNQQAYQQAQSSTDQSF